MNPSCYRDFFKRSRHEKKRHPHTTTSRAPHHGRETHRRHTPYKTFFF